MENEKLEKNILELLKTTELSNKEIATELGTTYQRVNGVAKRLQKGLGDKIEAITEATGIKAVVNAITKDCGCKKRKEVLNANTKYRLMREPSDDDLHAIYELSIATSFSPDDRVKIAKLRSHLFSIRYSVMNCSSCAHILRKQVNELKVVFDSYTEPA